MRDIAAIVYTSNTGFTMRYAQMLSQAAAIPAYDLEDGRSAPPAGAAVVYLGWLLAGRIKGLARARRRWNAQAVCAVGMAPDYPLEKLARENGTGSLPLFFVQGGYAPEKLRGVNRLMMQFMTKQVTKAPPRDAAEADLQKRFLHGGDFVEERNLEPLLAWLRGGDGL